MANDINTFLNDEIQKCDVAIKSIQKLKESTINFSDEIANQVKITVANIKKEEKNMISPKEYIFPKEKDAEKIRDQQLNSLLLAKKLNDEKFECISKINKYYLDYKLKSEYFEGQNYFCGLHFQAPEFEVTPELVCSVTDEYIEKEGEFPYERRFIILDPGLRIAIINGEEIKNLGPYENVLLLQSIFASKGIESFITCDSITERHEKVSLNREKEIIKANTIAVKKSVRNVGLPLMIFGFSVAGICVFLAYLSIILQYEFDVDFLADGLWLLVFLLGLIFLLPGIIGASLMKKRKRKISALINSNPTLYKFSNNYDDKERENIIKQVFESEKGKLLQETIYDQIETHAQCRKKFSEGNNDLINFKLEERIPADLANNERLYEQVIHQLETGIAINYREAFVQSEQIFKAEENAEEERRHREYLEELAKANYVSQEEHRQKMEEMEYERMSSAREAERNSAAALNYQKQIAKDTDKIKKDTLKTNRKIRDEIDKPY